MKRFLLLAAAVAAFGSTGCNLGNPCRQTLINWGWFNRGDSCCQQSQCGYTPSSGCDSCGGGHGPAPCSNTVPYASGGGAVIHDGGNWAPRAGAHYGNEAELVPPGPMNIVPRG